MKRFANAKWIYCKKAPDGAAVAFQKAFTFSKPVKTAMLYATAAGIYDVFVNGEKVDKRYFKPGLTSYTTRLQYQRFSLTKHIQKKTQLSIEVGRYASISNNGLGEII